MDLNLGGKVALVGGASKGLGRACAEELAREGAKVVICSRTEADLQLAASEIRESTGAEVFVYAGDLDRSDTIQDLVAAAVDHFGRIDILVANSGGPPLARAATADEETWNVTIQRSLLFFARMAPECVPHMKSQGGGRIINILSSTVFQPIDNLALSGAARMGVVAFSKSLSEEVGQDNILVNNVCPGDPHGQNARQHDCTSQHPGNPFGRSAGSAGPRGGLRAHRAARRVLWTGSVLSVRQG